MKETVDRIMDSDWDPGSAIEDEGDTSALESQDEGDRNILERPENTDYVDRVIKQDAAVRVEAHRHGRSGHDSDSSLDHSKEFAEDEMSPPQTLQQLRGKKRACSPSPPAHGSAKAPALSPVPGTSSMIRTSTPNSPGAVSAAFDPPGSMDDTVEGSVDLGDLSDDDVITMGQQPVPQNFTSGDSDSDSDTMNASDLNQQMRSLGDDPDDADDEDDAHDGRCPCFLYAGSFGLEPEQHQGDVERDVLERPNDDSDHAADASPPHPPNRGTRVYKEAGPCLQEGIKNFIETDYPEDVGIWKPTATYPMDNVKQPDLPFTRSPASNRADGLLFDPTGMSPLDFFYKMWPRKLFDHISAETNRHYDRRATEGHNNRYGEFDHFIDISRHTGTHLRTSWRQLSSSAWASQGPLRKNNSTSVSTCKLVPFVALSRGHFGSHLVVWSVSFKIIVSRTLSNNHI